MIEGIETVKALYEQMKLLEDNERGEFRGSIMRHIANVVDSITVFPSGVMIGEYDPDPEATIQPDPTRSFTVKFTNGMLRLVQPDRNWTFKLEPEPRIKPKLDLSTDC